jgi:hypothetical protein
MLGWLPLENFPELLLEFNETRNPSRFGLLLRRLELGCRSGLYPITEVVRESDKLVSLLPESLRKLWLFALTRCLVFCPVLPLELIQRTYIQIIEQAGDFLQLALFGRLLEQCIKVDLNKAINLIGEFLSSATVLQCLGRSATYRLSHKLQVPVAKLIDACSSSQRKAVLGIVFSIPPIFAASLIHVMVSKRPDEIREELDKLLDSPKVDEFVRLAILKERRVRETFSQPNGYAWLRTLVRTGN